MELHRVFRLTDDACIGSQVIIAYKRATPSTIHPLGTGKYPGCIDKEVTVYPNFTSSERPHARQPHQHCLSKSGLNLFHDLVPCLMPAVAFQKNMRPV